MKHSRVSIIWFRQDLRLRDNPALTAAAKQGKVIPVYILDNLAPKPFELGGATKVWLHDSLEKLDAALNGNLNFYKGTPHDIFESLSQKYGIQGVYWNVCYEPWLIKADYNIKSFFNDKNIPAETFNGNYLWHPNSVLKNDGTYYKVFTPYKKKALTVQPRQYIEPPETLSLTKDTSGACSLEALELLPKYPWHKKLDPFLTVGEVAAQGKLDDFIKKGLCGYKEGRNNPSETHTSKLSAHLHFGEISPAQILKATESQGPRYADPNDIEHFISEVIWREFSCYLLHHFNKNLASDNFNARFDAFPWKSGEGEALESWKKGLTGIPLVDAGMRELWQTGSMYNRVRMVVASFLVKNLRIHWHKGRDWFWDCLFDADLANNSASWQWVAGCGADAAPYFRIFNPVTQGEKFDPKGEYTRQFVPELAKLPDKYLFSPWKAPDSLLSAIGITLGETYPNPIVDLANSRNEALEAYKEL